MPAYRLMPQDVVVLPLGSEGLSGAESARGWPAPAFVFDAIHAALHRSFGQVDIWEHTHATRGSGSRDTGGKNQRFGSLATAGPFPCLESDGQIRWFFPRPEDCHAAGEGIGRLRPLKPQPGCSNLPAPLAYALVGGPEDGQDPLPGWWPKLAIESYLRGENPERQALGAGSQLYHLSPCWGGAKGRASKAPKLELRLREGGALGIAATMPLKELNRSEGLEGLFAPDDVPLILGGQQRICRVAAMPNQTLDQLLPLSQPVAEDRVQWLLLSPAIFPAIPGDPGRGIEAHPGGWLPNWVCPRTGRVLLKKGAAQRAAESREEWRRRVRGLPTWDCRLVAARVTPPITVGGWSERRHLRAVQPSVPPGPKTTWLAVPAGSVYYFEGPDAPGLAGALAWHGSAASAPSAVVHRRSGILGEKGFGLGVCGPWKFSEDL